MANSRVCPGWVIHTTVPDGKEHYQGMIMYDFQDGSTILAKVDASGDANAKKTGDHSLYRRDRSL